MKAISEQGIVIRPVRRGELDNVTAIWLEASRSAHAFVPFSYWQCQAVEIRDTYLPQSETYALQVGQEVVGFMSLVDSYLAALFIHPEMHGLGYGKKLLVLAQEMRGYLSLRVFKENRGAVSFYLSAGFRIAGEQKNLGTGHVELEMEWTKTSH